MDALRYLGLRRTFCLKITVCSRRSMSAFEARNPQERHFDRKKMLEICKPIVIPDIKPDWQTCPFNSTLPEVIIHPYEKLLANELKKNWETSKMICIFHINPVTNRERRKIYNMFFKKDFHFAEYSVDVVKQVVQDTPFESVLNLFGSNTALVFSPNIRIGEFLKLSKVDSHIHLLAALVDNRFYSTQQLQELNKLPSIETLYQLLSYNLSRASNISETVTHHTKTLSRYLTQLSKENN